MTKNTFRNTLKRVLFLGTLFMIGETVVHLSAVRIWGANQYWPESAILFVKLFMFLWGGISLLLAAFFYEIQKNVLQYIAFLNIMAYYSFFHGAILWYFSFLHLPQILPVPVMYVLNPYYSTQLKIEGSLLIAFGVFYLWGKNKKFLEK